MIQYLPRGLGAAYWFNTFIKRGMHDIVSPEGSWHSLLVYWVRSWVRVYLHTMRTSVLSLIAFSH